MNPPPSIEDTLYFVANGLWRIFKDLPTFFWGVLFFFVAAILFLRRLDKRQERRKAEQAMQNTVAVISKGVFDGVLKVASNPDFKELMKDAGRITVEIKENSSVIVFEGNGNQINAK